MATDTLTDTPPAETAPSAIRADQPIVPRVIGLVGLGFVVLGGAAVFANAAWGPRLISSGLGMAIAALGLAGLLVHATFDGEINYRRIYGIAAFLLLAVGVFISVVPGGTPRVMGNWFMPYGFSLGLLSLFFFIPFAKHETDEKWRTVVLQTLLAVGAVLGLGGMLPAIFYPDFVVGNGLLMALLGLGFLVVYVSQAGADDQGYLPARLAGLAGLLVFLYALGRTTLPTLAYNWKWTATAPAPFLVPAGLILMGLGLLYLLVSLGLTSENQLVVLTRRELSSFFYSPVAYIVLFALTVLGWINYFLFIGLLEEAGRVRQPLQEPIVSNYIIAYIPVFGLIFVVPALTMRLLSEERRSGSMEMLFTAPLTERTVVLGKFFGCLLFFIVLWVPWGLFLVALRMANGEPFDYRPLLSFYLALTCCGAACIAAGLFFSSLTNNQIVAAVLTFVFMFLLFVLWLVSRQQMMNNPVLLAVCRRMNFIDPWISAVQGQLLLRDVAVQLSMCVFWLFLTVKVLEARKWN